MRALFVDTGAWYAVQAPNDRWHREATEVLRQAIAGGLSLVTSNHVVGETYTLLQRTHGRAAGIRFVDAVGASSRLQLLHLDEAVERDAWELLRRYDDQAFSFVDATSFALMTRRKLRHAFAFDRHFSAAGFIRVPVDAALGEGLAR